MRLFELFISLAAFTNPRGLGEASHQQQDSNPIPNLFLEGGDNSANNNTLTFNDIEILATGEKLLQQLEEADNDKIYLPSTTPASSLSPSVSSTSTPSPSSSAQNSEDPSDPIQDYYVVMIAAAVILVCFLYIVSMLHKAMQIDAQQSNNPSTEVSPQSIELAVVSEEAQQGAEIL